MTETVGATRQELTDTERAVLDAVRDLARRGELVRDLGALLRIPSVTGSRRRGRRAAVGGAPPRTGSVSTSTTGRWTSTSLAAATASPAPRRQRTEAWGVVGTSHDDRDGDTPRRSCCRGTSTSSRPAIRRAGPATRSTPRIVGRTARDGRGACDMKAGVVATWPRSRRPQLPASGCAAGSRSTASSARRTAGWARSARCARPPRRRLHHPRADRRGTSSRRTPAR